MQLPGVGLIVAMTVLAALSGVTRFPNLCRTTLA